MDGDAVQLWSSPSHVPSSPPPPFSMHYSICEYGKMPGDSIIMIFGSWSLAITVLCLGVDWVSLSIGLLSIVVVVVVDTPKFKSR